jgi:hypothetical protein
MLNRLAAIWWSKRTSEPQLFRRVRDELRAYLRAFDAAANA